MSKSDKPLVFLWQTQVIKKNFFVFVLHAAYHRTPCMRRSHKTHVKKKIERK